MLFSFPLYSLFMTIPSPWQSPIWVRGKKRHQIFKFRLGLINIRSKSLTLNEASCKIETGKPSGLTHRGTQGLENLQVKRAHIQFFPKEGIQSVQGPEELRQLLTSTLWRSNPICWKDVNEQSNINRWDEVTSTVCVLSFWRAFCFLCTLEQNSRVKCMRQLSVDLLRFVHRRTPDTRDMSEAMGDFLKILCCNTYW